LDSQSPFLLRPTPRPPRSPLFPYTTLFRSVIEANACAAYNLEVVSSFEDFLINGGCRTNQESISFAYCPQKFIAVWSINQADLKDRKSTRLNSSHVSISYAVFCLKKKNNNL